MSSGVKLFLAVLGWVFILAVVYVSAQFMFTAAQVATAPGRVISKTLDTDNIIHNYEWFHDAHGQYKTRVAQLSSHREAYLATAGDQAERNRLRVEVFAVQQSCRDLANRYNANATKTNRSIFMGREAPESLDASKCEVKLN
jgi:hypothetical protein